MKLRNYLDFNGIKHKFFAQKLGISATALSSVVTEKSLPSAVLIKKIAILTNNQVTIDDFVPEDSIDWPEGTEPKKRRTKKP